VVWVTEADKVSGTDFGHIKKKFAAIRHPDNDVVDSSLIEQTRDVR
jgi:hypothetical protein